MANIAKQTMRLLQTIYQYKLEKRNRQDKDHMYGQ